MILTLAASRPEFLNTIAVLVARLGQPFILLSPTNRHLGPGAKELLASTGEAFFALEENVVVRSMPAGGSKQNGEGPLELSCTSPPRSLFEQVTSLAPKPPDEELARRAFLALQNEDGSVRRKPPSLYMVFELYCVKELTIPQIARKCGCAIGTVANRLKLLRNKTGVAPERLRRVAALFTKFVEDFSGAGRKPNKGRRNHE